jgi:hypothetical protein
MDLKSLNTNELRDQLFYLMDNVLHHLKTETDVDKFLDETDLLDEWEAVLPEAEFPIFIMAVLNNTRREIILDAILDSIIPKNESLISSTRKESKKNLIRSHKGEHPFS